MVSLTPLHITSNIYTYYQSVGFREHPVLTKIREDNAKTPQAPFQSAPEVAHFLAFLVDLLGAKHILEIGTFTGYSTLAMTLALPKGGHITACDKEKATTDKAQSYWTLAGVRDKITLKLGEGLDILETLDPENFDLIFIDANKNAYDAYYENALKLSKPGGLIILDNTLWKGDVAQENAEKQALTLKKLNDKIHKDPRVSMLMLPMADGLTLVKRT